MPNTYHPLHTSIVRILDAAGTLVGAGFLVAPALVCTCAHVVADALDIPRETEQPPEQEVHLDFPFLSGAKARGRVEAWKPIKPNDGGGDIAMLRLKSDPPPDAQPARLLPVSNLSDRDFAAYGFPRATDVGQWAYGTLRDRLAKNEWVQMEGTSGYPVQQGYSGTAVWDQRGRGVVGMVVAEDRTPEARVAFLIPNDLLQCACSDIQLVTFHQLFAPLTEGLAGLPGSPLGSMEQFLREYLGTPDAPVPFGGRQQQLEELDQWLADPAHPYALLVAEAGRGKSALLAHWVALVADARRAMVVFVPLSIRFGTALKTTALALLGGRLCYLHGEKADLPRDAEGWLAKIEIYLREDRATDSPLLIVLDGADEATSWMIGGRDLHFPLEPGRGIKVLVSARELADCGPEEWLQRLGWQGLGVPLTLPLLDQASVADVLRQMGFPLDRLGTHVDIVAQLYHLSDRGDPLLVRLYVDDLWKRGERTARLQPEDLKAFKPGLAEYFDQWWEQQQQQWKDQGYDPLRKQEDTLDFFNLCATALGPLSRDEVAAITKGRLAAGLRLPMIASEVGRFIIGDGQIQGYVFSHPRLGDYFFEKLTKQERKEWEQHFLEFSQIVNEELSSGKLDPHQAPSYAVRYYGAHLRRASAKAEQEQTHAEVEQYAEQCYALINAGWLQAWEALEGTYDGFLNDLRHAWSQAEVAGAHEQSPAERRRAIGLQCRYALIVTSIKSLASKIPSVLLALLVDKSVWTPVQGLAYIRQMSDKTQQAEALTALAPHLTEFLQWEEVLATARMIEDPQDRAVVQLVPQLPESQREGVLQKALAVAQMIEVPLDRAQVLVALVPQLPPSQREEILRKVLAAARMIEDVRYRTAMLMVVVQLVPYLPELQRKVVLRKVRAVARSIGWEQGRAVALAQLVPYLPELQRKVILRKVLAATQWIDDVPDRTQALAQLVPYLPELQRKVVLRKVLAEARAIEDPEDRVLAVARLAPQFSSPQREEVLQEVLTTARMIGKPEDRLLVLMVLLQLPLKLPLSLEDYLFQDILEDYLFQDTLAATRWIEDIKEFMRLAQLQLQLPMPLQKEALREMLATIQTFLKELSAEEALVKNYSRMRLIEMLEELIPHLPTILQEEVLREALAVARTFEDEGYRVVFLAELVPHLPASQQTDILREALATTQIIEDVQDQALALIGLVPYLSTPLLQEVLVVVRRATATLKIEEEPTLEGEPWESSQLPSLKSKIPILLEALLELMPRFGALGYGEEALVVVQTMKDPHDRLLALAQLVPLLPAPLQEVALRNALAATRLIEDVQDRAAVLAQLLSQYEDLFRPALPQHEGLKMLAQYEDEPLYIEPPSPYLPRHEELKVLAQLLPQLPDSQQVDILQEALSVAQTIEDVQYRVAVLKPLARTLGYGEEVLAVIRTIEDPLNRAQMLAELVPHLPALQQADLLQEALALVRIIDDDEDERYRAAVLKPLAGTLGYGEEVLTKALLIEGDEDGRYRAKILKLLVAQVARLGALGHEEEALAVARTIEDPQNRALTLARLTLQLSGPRQEETLRDVLAVLRKMPVLQVIKSKGDGLSIGPLSQSLDLLEALLELMPRLGVLGYGKEALAVARMIREDKYQVLALAHLALHLSTPLQEKVLHEVLAVARSIGYEDYQAEALKALAQLVPQLPASQQVGLRREVLAIARSIKDPQARALALEALARQLPLPEQTGLLREVVAVARTIKDPQIKVLALEALARQLPLPEQADLLREALTASRSIEDERQRAEILRTLTQLPQQLPLPLQQDILWEAMVVAHAIENKQYRGWVMETLLEELLKLMPRLGALGYGKEALAVARMIGENEYRAMALARLMPYLSKPLQQEAVAVAHAIENKQYRGWVLVELARQLPASQQEDLLREVVAMTRSIEDERQRAEVLEALARQLPLPEQTGLLREVAAVARTIKDPQIRARALEALARQSPLPEQADLLRDAVAVARTIEDERDRALVLGQLAQQLSGPLQEFVLREVLAVARTTNDTLKQVQILSELAPRLEHFPSVTLYPFWCETLHILASRTRSHLLSNIKVLTPFIMALGENEALDATAQAIVEVGKWFP